MKRNHILKKLRYRDTLRSKYFFVMIFIVIFCMFTSITYSFFTLNKSLNAATITVNKFNYELSSTNPKFINNSIAVSPNEVINLDLSLKSLNVIDSKYAINYESDNEGLKVYYEEKIDQNISGIIATSNSIIDAKVVLENTSATSATVTFEVNGGYTQNELAASNITDLYEMGDPVAKIVEFLKITPKTGTATFANAATNDEGVYTMEDDYGTSYYYRGNITNNYVQFAGFYWRIIRVNGDGTIRMIYDGTVGYANGQANTNRMILFDTVWNNNYNDVKYVGYTYGPAGTTKSTSAIQAQSNVESSNIKTKLENWYKTNIVDKGYNEYVADRIFCNDREVETDLAHANNGSYSSYSTNAFGTNKALFKPGSRVGYAVTSPNPSFKCSQTGDAFTRDEANGNGALTYPVGLITADEATAAGSGINDTINKNYYLYKGAKYWTMSPSNGLNSGGYAIVFYIGSNGEVSTNSGNVNASGGIAPVINLNTRYFLTFTGNGTVSNPYRAS